jgi:hypothetical protein
VDSVLAHVDASEVKAAPFPHVAVRGAIDDGLCRRLLDEFPSLEAFTKDGGLASNKRMGMSAGEVLGNEDIAPIWREFIQNHISAAFLKQLTAVFGDHIRRVHPGLESEIGDLGGLRAGIRHVDSFETADVLLDAQISINTPVFGAPSSVRRAHLDDPDKLIAGLFYLRHPDDNSSGGDLELYRYRQRPRGFRDTEIYDTFVDAASTVRYERGTLVMFVNSEESLHGVTVRSQTEVPRYFVNLIANVRQPLFDVKPYQATLWDKVLAGPERVGKRVRKKLAAA